MEGLLKYQVFVVESLEQENQKFHEFDLQLKEAKDYLDRLLAIKQDVKTIQEKSQRLKQRALRLQDKKQKEALDMELKRDRVLEEERKLTPVFRSSS